MSLAAAPESGGYGWRRKLGLPLGAAVFLLVVALPGPEGLPPAGQRVAAVALLMAIWWITEALPIAVTALLPLALFPLLSVLTMGQAAAPYAEPTIFLFMGGFLIALAMQKWGLHRRLGLYVIAAIGSGPRRMLAGFMAATAFLSMWVSNTATAAMMLPIGLAVAAQFAPGDAPARGQTAFPSTLMLGIAYAASIGGIATLVGTPPNLVFAGQAAALFPELGGVGFVQWLKFGLPLAAGFLVIAWVALSARLGPSRQPAAALGGAIRDQARALGRWSRGEVIVMAAFTLTALAWLTRESLTLGSFVIPGWNTLPGLGGATDATVAITAALLLFLIPVGFKRPKFVMDAAQIGKLPWDVLLLFGGGFSLAEGFSRSGLAAWLAGNLTGLGALPLPMLILAVCLLGVLLSELASNTATATLLMPIMGAIAVSLGLHPYLLMVPAAVASSLGFMLPVATPPNAIAFSSGYITMPQMARAGLLLDILGILWATLVTLLLVGPVFGV